MLKTIMDRILSRIDITDGGCWLWLGCKTAGGYGRISTPAGKRYVHRVMYEIVRGAIPDGLELDHLCRNRSCCNPDHLEAVNHKININRGERNTGKMILSRENPALFRCGHPANSENRYVVRRATRTNVTCRTCKNKKESERKKRIRAGL